MRRWRIFIFDTSGASSIEYGLIAGLISILVVLGATTIGTTISSKFFTPVSSALQ